MHQHLEKRTPGRFDLKQASGGMTDLEFITQFLCCAKPRACPIGGVSDNRRQLERWRAPA